MRVMVEKVPVGKQLGRVNGEEIEYESILYKITTVSADGTEKSFSVENKFLEIAPESALQLVVEFFAGSDK